MTQIHVSFPHDDLLDAYDNGEYTTNATEPWTQQLLTALAQSIGAKTIIEFGSHTGLTSAWLGLTLQAAGGGKLICVDVNEEYCEATTARLKSLPLEDVEIEVLHATAVEAIDALGRHTIDFAFVDFLSDGRQIKAVLEGLWSWWDSEGLQRMSLGGLIAVHDVSRGDVAAAVVGHHGYVIETKRLHREGGLGLVQIPVE